MQGTLLASRNEELREAFAQVRDGVGDGSGECADRVGLDLDALRDRRRCLYHDSELRAVVSMKVMGSSGSWWEGGVHSGGDGVEG